MIIYAASSKEKTLLSSYFLLLSITISDFIPYRDSLVLAWPWGSVDRYIKQIFFKKKKKFLN